MKPLIYDVHLTFKGMTEEFRGLIDRFNIPIITIRLINGRGTQQIMTNLKSKDFQKDVRFIRSLAKAYGVKVDRIKVECAREPTWNAYYFECHFHAPKERFHLPMSIRMDKESEITYTFRCKNYTDFMNGYNRLQLARFTTKIEKCIYDSDVNYDKGWI